MMDDCINAILFVLLGDGKRKLHQIGQAHFQRLGAHASALWVKLMQAHYARFDDRTHIERNALASV
jgi:hypothetical protein